MRAVLPNPLSYCSTARPTPANPASQQQYLRLPPLHKRRTFSIPQRLRRATITMHGRAFPDTTGVHCFNYLCPPLLSHVLPLSLLPRVHALNSRVIRPTELHIAPIPVIIRFSRTKCTIFCVNCADVSANNDRYRLR